MVSWTGISSQPLRVVRNLQSTLSTVRSTLQTPATIPQSPSQPRSSTQYRITSHARMTNRRKYASLLSVHYQCKILIGDIKKDNLERLDGIGLNLDAFTKMIK